MSASKSTKSRSSSASSGASNGKKKRPLSPNNEEEEEEQVIDDDYELPSVEEWASFKSYRTCQLPDEDQTRITKGSVIYVQPGEVVLPSATVKRSSSSTSSSSTPSSKKGKGKEKKRQKKEAKAEVWLAKILDIRAKVGDAARVFLEIQWYYNYDQLKQIRYVHLRKLNLCGQEVVLSDHREIIPISSCQDLATIFEFDATNLDQVSFDRRDYFTRHRPISFNLEPVPDEVKQPSEPSSAKNRKKSKSSITQTFPVPIPISRTQSTCTCSKPYNPLPLALSTRMHYCPRSTCQKWFHAACLKEKKTAKKGRKSSMSRKKEDGVELDGDGREEQKKAWDLNFMLSMPPTKTREDEEEVKEREASEERVLQALEPPVATKPSSSLSASSNTSKILSPKLSIECSHYTTTTLSLLPPLLLAIASSPIVRGTPSRGVGIVGNAEAVVQARRMVREVVVLGMELAKDWRERCLLKKQVADDDNKDGEGDEGEGSEDEEGGEDGLMDVGDEGEGLWKEERKTIFACPGCQGGI